MRKRRIVWILLVAILALLAAGALLLPSSEPVYQGRKLSEWLAEVNLYSQPEISAQARNAVREVGTNGIPWLLKELDAKDSRLKQRMIWFARGQNWMRSSARTDRERQERAILGLTVLGPQAKAALPALRSRLDRSQSAPGAAYALASMIKDRRTNEWSHPTYLSQSGLEELGSLRREVLAAGLKALTSHQAATRAGGLIILEGCAFDAASAVPGLIRGLKETNEMVRVRSVQALGILTSQPVAAIPPLIDALTDSSPLVRMTAASSLGYYYRQAKTAVPALLKARSDPDSNVRVSVKVALDKIDPETAAMIPDLPDFKPLPPASGESP